MRATTTITLTKEVSEQEARALKDVLNSEALREMSYAAIREYAKEVFTDVEEIGVKTELQEDSQ